MPTETATELNETTVVVSANATRYDLAASRMLMMETDSLECNYGHTMGPWEPAPPEDRTPGTAAFAAACVRCGERTVQRFRPDGHYVDEYAGETRLPCGTAARA